jgi:fructoselysine-6-P-deglycase FrlB-like protein
VEREIHSQPQVWVSALSRLAQVSRLLPQPGERVAVIGCGTSWFMATAYAFLREATGSETDSFAASQFPSGRSYDRVVVISRSGTTTEAVRAIETTRSPVVAVTAVPGSPVAEAADHAVVLELADEKSIVQTVFATTTLMLLRASLGADVAPVVAQTEAVLAGGYPVPAALAGAGQVTFLGQGWPYGIAQEAALKMREAAQLWTEAYPQMEYRHGPISIAEPGRGVWVFGPPVDGLREELAATGVVVVDDDLDPMADLVRAQLFAVARAHGRGLDPDRPRSLTRSVLLADPTP